MLREVPLRAEVQAVDAAMMAAAAIAAAAEVVAVAGVDFAP